MADYAPLYLYADQITGTISADVTGGQTLMVTGDDTIGPADADADNYVGVAAMDGAANSRISYHPRGKVHVTAATGAVTAGDQVSTAAAGGVASGGSNPIGVALTTASDGDQVRWMEF